MNSETDKNRRRLSLEERNRIFDEKILPAILTGHQPATQRTFAVVSSQPGGGKSTMVRQLTDRFKGERTISISLDDFYNYLPGMNEARMTYATWGDILPHENAAVSDWYVKSLNYVSNEKTHLILESCNDEQSTAKFYRKNGFEKAELYIIATDKFTSLTSIFVRATRGFQNRSMANCAILDKEAHDEIYAQFPRIAFEVETSGSFDTIALVKRDQGVFYENDVVKRTENAPQWRKTPEAYKKLILLNNGLFTQQKFDHLNAEWKCILNGPIAGHSQFQGYPLEKYKNDVLSYAENPGTRFDPDIVLPKNRATNRRSYLALLRSDFLLISANLDPAKQSDVLLSNKLAQMFGDIRHRTKHKLSVGNRWKKDIDEQVAQDTARETAKQQSSASSRGIGSNIDRGYGSLNGTEAEARRSEKDVRQTVGAEGNGPSIRRLQSPGSNDGSVYGTLDLTAEEFDRLERTALQAHGLLKQPQGNAEKPQQANLGTLDQAPPAKRPRYEGRSRDEAGRA